MEVITSKYTCICKKTFKTVSGLWKHQKKCAEAKENDIRKSGPNACIETGCTFKYRILKDYRSHLSSEHSIENRSETLKFKCRNDFMTWKEEYEKSTVSWFLKDKSIKSKSHTTDYFYCNRSGQYESESTGKRCLKKQGSSKIGSVCPAALKATYLQDGKVQVLVHHTHHGHQNQLCHLRLPELERANIAARLALGENPKKILHNIYSSKIDKLERKHLTVRKDVENIARSYGSQRLEKLREDNLSTETQYAVNQLIEENANEDIQLVVLYQTNEDTDLHFENNLQDDRSDRSRLNQGKQDGSEIATLQAHIVKKLMAMCDAVKACKNKDLLLTVQSQINATQSLLTIPQVTVEKNNFEVKDKTSKNKKREPQRRFSSRIKKRVKTSTCFGKPSPPEKEEIVSQNQFLRSENPQPESMDIEHSYSTMTANEPEITIVNKPVDGKSIDRCVPKSSQHRSFDTKARKFLSRFLSPSTIPAVANSQKKNEEGEVQTMPELVNAEFIDINAKTFRSYFTSDASLIVEQVF